MKINVIGDYLIDRYRFYRQTRTDPANDNAPVVELIEEFSVNGGAGNLVRHIESLCSLELHFFHASCLDEPGWHPFPVKVRHYVDNNFFLREDVNDKIEYDEDIVNLCIEEIEPDDFVIISDYHKGTIKKSDVIRIKEQCHFKGATIFVDTNHIWDAHYNIDWLKVNLKTAQDFMKVENRDGDSTMISKDIFEKTGSNVIVTMGDKGCVAYIKELGINVIFTKDKDDNFIDSIGAGDSFLAGFVSYMAKHDQSHLPALVYADIVAHFSTQQLGTINRVTKEMADKEYRNAKTFIKKGRGGKLYVNRTIDNV